MQILDIIDKAADFAEGFAEAGRHRFTSAVILAGGIGSRMTKGLGTDVTKQFLTLGGEPVILRTVRMFDLCPLIDEIILVVRPEEKAQYMPLLASAQIKKPVRFAKGGETRQDSALAGLKAVNDKCEYIAIHDGARPLILPEQIAAVAKEAYRLGAAAAASRAKDTVKITDGAQMVKSTPERENVWLASTPQIFKIEEYRAAVYIGMEKQIKVTDDCSLAEAVGFPVKMVDVGYQNLKLTTVEDLYFAEAILAMRGEKENHAEV